MREDSFRNKNVLITGGLGFIGSNLAKRLVSLGASVTVIDALNPHYGGNLHNVADIKDQLQIEIIDVRDTRSLNRFLAEKDYLFNLAGQTSHLDSMEDPFTDLEINATSQLALLTSCRSLNPDLRVVFASTRQIYGRPLYSPVDEKHPVRPVDINGINKYAGEQYHLLFNEVYKIPTTVLRLTNTIGPCMRIKDARQTFVGIWVKNLLMGEKIKVFGDGKQTRDFNDVEDVVSALLLAAGEDRAIGKIYNLGGAETISLFDLAKKMIELAGQGDLEIVPFPTELKKIDIGNYTGSFSLIQEELGWFPQVALYDSLSRLINFYRDNLKYYN
jgi:UDP-glucose 4-epimerase